MEFITVEQFREQPIEVQRVFLEWWKDEEVKIYAYRGYPTCLMISKSNYNEIKNVSGGIIPLFTEGQLRKFIEDKTNRKSQFMLHPFSGYYVFPIVRKEAMLLHAGTDDLLQAYWKVACILAKESLNG